MGYQNFLFAVAIFFGIPYVSALDKELPRNCFTLKEKSWKRLCQGNYPVDLIIKYKDSLVKPSDPYIMFVAADNPEQFFIAFKDSPLHYCNIIEVIDYKNFVCQDNVKRTTLALETGVLHCIPFRLELVKDLADDCLKDGGNFTTNSFATFYYANRH